MRSTGLHTTFALLLLGAIACSDPSQPGDQGPSGNIVPVQGVKLIPQSVQLSAIGATRQLLVTISPIDATDQAILWESTDSTVASVDAGGLVTAKAAGAGVFITAITHDGHFQASVNVTVNP
jgi:uncharacterized protein YjdB